MARFYRYQNTDTLETHPSLHQYDQVEVGDPADQDGWPGFVWAWIIDPNTDRPAWDEDYLIRAADVPAAQAGECVDVFLPGLCGTESLGTLAGYVRDQVGGADQNAFIAIYEGEKVCEVWDGVVFAPHRLVAVYPASDLPRLVAKEEEEN